MTERQRPAYSLDHVLIAVRDLERASRTYSGGLGFSLSPEGVHPGRGTHNRLIVFASEYLELIGYRDRSEGEFRPTMTTFLQRREGLYMFALGTGDLDRAVSDLRGKGLAVGDPVHGARQASEGRPGYSWRSAALPSDATPGSETFVIQHDATIEERYAEPPGLADHRNGARGVHSLEIAVADAESAASRWRGLLGLAQPPASDEVQSIGGRRVRLSLRNCLLDFVSPVRAGDLSRFLEANGEAPYRLTLESGDLASTTGLLRELAPDCSAPDGDALSIRPECAHGVPLTFL